MNHYKSTAKAGVSTYLVVGVTFVAIAIGGVRYAYCKNRQVQVSREIDAVERRIEQCELDIRTVQMRSENLVNRFALRKQLQESGSRLRPIPVGLPEEVGPAAATPTATASLP